MTNEEKRAALAATLAPDTDTEEVLDNVLDDAEALVLNRMYPFGYPDGTVVPTRYERIQIQLAAELYSKRGAEGQISHSENGISRTWLEESALLKRVIPHVGSVVTGNA
jgi:hypothetical protein